MNITDGSKVRSRVQWLEEGERTTRYFFKLEGERFERNINNNNFFISSAHLNMTTIRCAFLSYKYEK